MNIEKEDAINAPSNTYIDILEDDDTVRRMVRYFRQPNSEDLVKYIKRYGTHRHASDSEPLR